MAHAPAESPGGLWCHRPPESVRHFIELAAQASAGVGSMKAQAWRNRPPQRQRRHRGADRSALLPPAKWKPCLGIPNAREKLGWTPTTTLEDLVNEMIAVDQEEARKEAYLQAKGFQVVGARE